MFLMLSSTDKLLLKRFLRPHAHSQVAEVVHVRPWHSANRLESDGHVVELDDVVEMPAMTISAILGSVVGALVPGPSFSLSAAKVDMLIWPGPRNF